MVEYLKNIIPRIKQYSKELDKSENFVDKNWIYIDDNKNQHEYIFLRDKRLIMTLNSVTKEGTWELLPTGQLLIRRSSTDLVKLENIFVQNALLVLKQSATEDIPFVLINQQLIPDLDVVSYLEEFEKQQERITIQEPEQFFKILSTGELSGPTVYEGKIIKTYDNTILRGTYKVMTDKNAYEKYVVIFDNRITRLFFKVPYRYNNTKLIIEQREYSNPTAGDKIIDGTLLNIPVNQIVKIENNSHERFSIKVSSDYKIAMSFDSQIIFVFTITIIIFILIILFLIASKS